MAAEERTSVSLGFNLPQLQGLIGHVKETPEAGKTVWKARTEWKNGFQSQAQIRDFTINMDEPALLGAAARHGVGIEGLSLHSYMGTCPPGLVLGHAHMAEAAIERGVQLLAIAGSHQASGA